ncbi:hypothetical protein H6G89_34085 [Oscillatoria sp. FACHB-1407]|uniref:hypothetical protein n=1 Tax=Oscillatoria sp. FACHB-1407 TaxID=2692847 RepID=UPI001688657F|nr:hypothetical protein [Oscillatoria sp. FACHB-1407]MBD2466018.1 hypothetical protein [Oscillatoria sp. FACHB-1407]
MTVDIDSGVQSRPRFPLKIFGLLLFASVFASFSTILYGTDQAVSLLEVLLVAGLLSAIVTAPLAGLGLWSRRKQDIEDSSFARLLVKDELIFSLCLAIALGIVCGIFVVLSDKAFYSFLPTAIRDVELPGSLSGMLAAFEAVPFLRRNPFLCNSPTAFHPLNIVANSVLLPEADQW